MIIEQSEVRLENARKVLFEGRKAIENGDFVMDFRQVEKIDSASVAVVLDWIRCAQQRGATLKLLHRPAAFDQLTELYGLSAIIPS